MPRPRQIRVSSVSEWSVVLSRGNGVTKVLDIETGRETSRGNRHRKREGKRKRDEKWGYSLI